MFNEICRNEFKLPIFINTLQEKLLLATNNSSQMASETVHDFHRGDAYSIVVANCEIKYETCCLQMTENLKNASSTSNHSQFSVRQISRKYEFIRFQESTQHYATNTPVHDHVKLLTTKLCIASPTESKSIRGNTCDFLLLLSELVREKMTEILIHISQWAKLLFMETKNPDFEFTLVSREIAAG